MSMPEPRTLRPVETRVVTGESQRCESHDT